MSTKGYKFSPEWKAAARLRMLGNTRRLGHNHSSITKAKMSAALKGHVVSEETKTKIRNKKLGTPRPEHLRGANCNFWRGGITPSDKKIRASLEYKAWRRHVFARDDYTCQACGERGCYLQAHHDLPFSKFPELRFEILNGVTLCVPCHRKTPTFGFGVHQQL